MAASEIMEVESHVTTIISDQLNDDRYAFLLMLIEHALRLTQGWFVNFVLKGDKGSETIALRDGEEKQHVNFAGGIHHVFPDIYQPFWSGWSVDKIGKNRLDFFHKIFNGLGEISDIPDIDGLYRAALGWNELNWYPLHPVNTPEIDFI